MRGKEFTMGIRQGVPVGLGYFSVSFGFGALASAQGLRALDATLISLTNLTSAGQFAGLTRILASAGLWEMVLTQLVINSRYALMSLSISQKMDSDMNTPRRLFFSFMNTDEIFAVASSQPGKVSHWYLYGLMTAPYLGWSVGTILGAVAGTLLMNMARVIRSASSLRSLVFIEDFLPFELLAEVIGAMADGNYW